MGKGEKLKNGKISIYLMRFSMRGKEGKRTKLVKIKMGKGKKRKKWRK